MLGSSALLLFMICKPSNYNSLLSANKKPKKVCTVYIVHVYMHDTKQNFHNSIQLQSTSNIHTVYK